MLIFPVFAIACYLISLSLIVPSVLKQHPYYPKIALITAVAALIFHTVTLQQRIFSSSSGQDISLLNITSSINLIICMIMTFVAAQHRGWLLLPILYSFAIINLTLASFTPWGLIAHLENKIELLIHVFFALFSYATLTVAALYALQLMFIDYRLKKKTFYFNKKMPPLMTIEKKLFYVSQVGFCFLTLTLLTGFLYIQYPAGSGSIDKTLLSVSSWCVYFVFLWGHYQKDGETAVLFGLI